MLIASLNLQYISCTHLNAIKENHAFQNEDLLPPVMSMFWETSSGLEFGQVATIAIIARPR